MKKFTQTLGTSLLIALTFSCATSPQKETNEEKKNVVVLLYDISASNDEFAVLKPEHLEQLYRQIGIKGGGTFYGFHIKTFSLKQDAFTAEIPKLEIYELKGSTYVIKNRRIRNNKATEDFEENIPDFVHKAANRLIVAKNEGFTDIQNALWLASNTLKQQTYTNYNKHLIMVSDCINDLPPRDGRDPINVIEFPLDVKIIVVGQNPHVDIFEIFPKHNAENFTSIEQAINHI